MIRDAVGEDIASVHRLVVELAIYEKEPASVVETTAETMRNDFEAGAFNAFVAVRSEDGKVVGFAMWYERYSTWTGRCVYLEDLYVEEASRGRGVGSSLFEAVIKRAAEKDAARMEWVCLDWNKEAFAFYEKFSTHTDPTWVQCKLVRSQLQQLK